MKYCSVLKFVRDVPPHNHRLTLSTKELNNPSIPIIAINFQLTTAYWQGQEWKIIANN
jgi:hypothetical protein